MISSTMWEIITAVRTLLLTQTGDGGTLSQVQQVKRGMLAPRAPFPQMAIIPVSEQYRSLNSGNRATLAKNVEIILYWRDLRGKSATRDMETHVDNMVSLIESKRQLPDDGGNARTMSANIGGVNFAEEEMNQGVFHTARLPVTYIVKEDLPSPTTTVDTVDDPGVRGMGALIYDNLMNDSTLSANIRDFHDTGFGPFEKFPCIIVEAGVEMPSPVFAGADQLSQQFDVSLMSPILRAADTELQSHLGYIEDIKARLWTSLNLSGKAQNRAMGVDHGSTVISQRTLYISRFPLQITARANVTPG